VPLEARVVPASLENGTSENFGGTATPLSGTVMPNIFAQDLHIFAFNQLQNPFLLLHDSIFHIFVHEIK